MNDEKTTNDIFNETLKRMENLFSEYYNNSPWYKKAWLWLRGWRDTKSQKGDV